MTVPFVDLKCQYQSIKTEIDRAIENVLETSSFVLGKAVTEFESRFAHEHQVRHCCALSSGTDGNHLALWVLGVGPGDEVIIPANTFIATAWGATLCGATPVFVDCDSESYNVDPGAVEKAITPKTKAIVAVHLYGQPANMDPLIEIAARYNIHLIEDCAQAHLSEYNGKKVGGIGEIASWSFYPGKNLGAYGEAGANTTNDDELAAKCRMLRDHGSSQKYHHELLGHNYRMEGIQGAVLGVKLKYLEAWTEKRRQNANLYQNRLEGVGDIVLPAEMSYAKHVYHLYVIQTSKRDGLQNYLTSKGVSTGLHYPIPIHLQKCFSSLGYKKGDFPVAERLAERCLSLPMYAELTLEQIEYVTNTIREFYS